jgi:hypothetical protein
MAVERGGRRRGEILRSGVQETATLPGAAAAWSSYVDAHPTLLLAYASTLPPEAGRPLFDAWWKARGATATDLTAEELDAFYTYAPQWGSPEQLEHWISRHPQWRERDVTRWASLFLRWEKAGRAWELLSAGLTEPAFPDRLPAAPVEQLEVEWEASPGDLVNARALAHARAAAGDEQESRRIVVEVAGRSDAPAWFLQKGAFLLAREGKFADAAGLLLRVAR